MKQPETAALYALLTGRLIERGLTASTMESCTAGEIVSLLTDVEGSSAVIRGGLVTYCNDAKTAFGVPPETIARHGVYSPETALAMAKCCRAKFGTDVGIGVTGSYANPDPNNADSVPGTVYYALNVCGKETAYRVEIASSTRREAKTETATRVALSLLEQLDAAPAEQKGREGE